MAKTARAAAKAVRIETDSFGPIEVDGDKYWGAQTERSRQNFRIGSERMPAAIVRALALVKLAAAETNRKLGLLDRRFVLEQAGVGLRGAAHVAEQRTDGGEDGCHDGQLAGMRVSVLRRVLQFVVVRAVHVESMSRHFKLLVFCGR